MTPMRKAVAATAAIVLMGIGAPHVRAAENLFLDRFKGSWIGSGSVRRDGESRPWQIDCKVTGYPSKNRISIQGSCRALLIVQRQVRADLTFDPRSGVYRGIYTGARVGPAQLSGRRNGDAINLRIAWPKPVNGDMEAMLVIRNEGGGALRITVSDNLVPGGPVIQTSDIVLRQQ